MSWRDRQALKDKEKEDQEMRRQVWSLAGLAGLTGSACLTHTYAAVRRTD